MRIHTDTIDGEAVQIGYKVVTEDLRSLGLRRNPNILQFELGEWYSLAADRIEEGKGDWGGIWVARTPSGATKLRDYMDDHHDTKVRIFKARLDQILYLNTYRIKTSGVLLYEEL